MKLRRGFAVMDPKLQRELAQRGGQRAHELGRAHEWTSAEARAAGIKGGQRWQGMTEDERAARAAHERSEVE